MVSRDSALPPHAVLDEPQPRRCPVEQQAMTRSWFAAAKRSPTSVSQGSRSSSVRSVPVDILSMFARG